MKRMGFTFDPGPLPFTTIRRHDWGNRIWVNELIEVHGEHGCTMPPTAARVVSITPYSGTCPPHLVPVYAGRPLVAIELAHEPGWTKVGESWVQG